MNATQKTCESIREMIVSGKIPPGAPLREGDLAQAVGVSRTPVREALRLLTASGLAQFIPNQGAIVSVLTARDAEEIFSVRLLLESGVAAEAAAKMPAETLEQLIRLQDEMESFNESTPEARASIAQLNRKFHGMICHSVGENRLAAAALSYIDYPVMLATFQRYSKSSIERGRQHHRELIDAFKARDRQWAEAVMRCHILAARDCVLGSYAEAAAAHDGKRMGKRTAK